MSSLANDDGSYLRTWLQELGNASSSQSQPSQRLDQSHLHTSHTALAPCESIQNLLVNYQEHNLWIDKTRVWEPVLCTYRCRSMTRSWTSFRLLIRAKVLWLPFVSETNVNHFREWCNNKKKKTKETKKTSTSAKFLMSLSNAMLLKVARAQLTSKVNAEAAWSNGFSGI